MSEDTFILPSAPNDLCFRGNDFVESNFDVDTFLQEHRSNASLETMRDNLGAYLKILRSAMIELINRDYIDFVNLSSNLIGLDKAIDNLEAPLGQLREQVMQILQALDGATVQLSHCLDEHRTIREKKQSLQSLEKVYKSITKLSAILASSTTNPNVPERAATEFNQLKFHASRCNAYLTPEYTKKCQQLDCRLMENVAALLITYVNKQDASLLVRCLQIYVTLDKIEEAEELVRKKVVQPAVENVIVEENVQNEPLGLRGIYQRLLNFLNSEMKLLLDVTTRRDSSSVKGFNLLVNSFWPEIEERIELNLKIIFAPGNPQLFHTRYLETLDFLLKLEETCDSPETMLILKNHSLYKRFINKWNLPVYFQIRFQEIAGDVEESLCQPISCSSVKNNVRRLDDEDFSLHASCVTWNNLGKIWADGIFLPQLVHQFWKLWLQIISRYQVWCEDALTQPWPSVSTPMTSNIIECKSTTQLDFFVCIHNDVEIFSTKLPTLLDVARTKLGNVDRSIAQLLEASLEEARKNLGLVLPLVTEKIVAELLAQSAPKLKQVSDIPRLFRRTMRDKPTQPCGYVNNALGHLLEFQKDYQNTAPNAVRHWLELTLSALTEEYFSSVKDVLESVRKTEESLRRLKKIRDKSTGTLLSESQGITDDEKIRIQLEIDVRSYTKTISSFGLTPSNVSNVQELLRVVEEAVKNKN